MTKTKSLLVACAALAASLGAAAPASAQGYYMHRHNMAVHHHNEMVHHYRMEQHHYRAMQNHYWHHQRAMMHHRYY